MSLHKGVSFSLIKNYGFNGLFGFHICKACQIRISFLSRYYCWLRIPFYHKDNTRELFYSIVDDVMNDNDMNQITKNDKNAYSEIAYDMIKLSIIPKSTSQKQDSMK